MTDRITDPLVRITMRCKQQLDFMGRDSTIYFAESKEQRIRNLAECKEEYECLKSLLTPGQDQVLVEAILSQEEPDMIVDGAIHAGKITANSISAGSITAAKILARSITAATITAALPISGSV
jgi:hypothetical protein